MDWPSPAEESCRRVLHCAVSSACYYLSSRSSDFKLSAAYTSLDKSMHHLAGQQKLTLFLLSGNKLRRYLVSVTSV